MTSLHGFRNSVLAVLCFLLSSLMAGATDEFSEFDDLDHRDLQGGGDSSRVNIFQKLGESIGLTIVGCLLICLIPIVIWKNEGRHVRELQRIDFCKNEAVVVDCESADQSSVDRLVHFTGEISVGDESLGFSKSDGLNVTSQVPKALLVKRTCYIYQKFEKQQTSVQHDRIGGGETRTTTYQIVEDWTPRGPQPATLPKSGETNSRGLWDAIVTTVGEPSHAPRADIPDLPPEILEKLGLMDYWQPPHGMVVSPNARVGEFRLSEAIVVENQKELWDELKPIPNECLPDTVEGCIGLFKYSDNILRTFQEGAQPQNGDIKVVYEYAEAGFDASFVVAQTVGPKSPADEEEALNSPKFGVEKHHAIEDKCGICHNDLGEIWMVRNGRHDLEEMVQMAKVDESNLTKMMRILLWVLLCCGWAMLFSPFLTALQVLPILANLGRFAVVLVAIIVSLLCCCTVTILAYVRFRPLLGTALLVIAGGIWGLVAWRLSIAVEEGGDDQIDDAI